jgi:hypothetical protein
MSTTSSIRLWALFASTAAAALTGCFDGGGDGDDPPPPPPPVSGQVPPSAYASTDALFSFALDQSAMANTTETGEPLGFDLVTGEPPVSDTTEPTALP